MQDIKDRSTNHYLSKPTQLPQEVIDYAIGLKNGAMVPFFVPELDEISNPLRPHEVTLIQALPGQAKTTLSIALAARIAQNMPDTRPPLFVTRETVVEDISLNLLASKMQVSIKEFYRGNVSEIDIKKNALSLADLGIWVVGRKAKHFGNMDVDPLNLQHVYNHVQDMQSHGLSPSVVFIDYAQKFEPTDSKWRDSEAAKFSYVFKEMEHFAHVVGVPVVLLAQSGQHVAKYEEPLGELSDIQWSSTGSQIATRVYSLLRPSTFQKWDPSNSDNHWVTIGGKQYVNNGNLLIVRKHKERGNQAYDQIGLDFNPATLTIKSLPEMIDMNLADSGQRMGTSLI